jgi:Uma2 family endonuclease
MATTAGLMTFAEFEKLPDPVNGDWYELHHGELVRMTRPAMKHFWAQKRLVKLLEPLAADFFIATEFSFRAKVEHEFRVADVGALSLQRMAQVDPDRHLIGAPELVIEIVSPSNTATELLDKRLLCLNHGCQEFWIVYPDKRTIEVFGYGALKIYMSGQRIPIQLFGGAEIAVDDVFRVPELENL